jgi:hypothetical protein
MSTCSDSLSSLLHRQRAPQEQCQHLRPLPAIGTLVFYLILVLYKARSRIRWMYERKVMTKYRKIHLKLLSAIYRQNIGEKWGGGFYVEVEKCGQREQCQHDVACARSEQKIHLKLLSATYRQNIGEKWGGGFYIKWWHDQKIDYLGNAQLKVSQKLKIFTKP